MPSTPKSLDYKRWPNYKAGVALGVCTVKRENWSQNEWLSKDCPLVGLCDMICYLLSFVLCFWSTC